ncbi:MAG: PKD domain-containing protein [Myxococcota bacterium]|nr:PKD domain-containing protein [Myxococcota bacterium]
MTEPIVRRAACRLLALLALAAPGACTFPEAQVFITPEWIALVQGGSQRADLRLGAIGCSDEPECVDVSGLLVDYGFVALPPGVHASLDRSLQTTDTPDLVFATFHAAADAVPGLYDVSVHAMAGGGTIGTRSFRLAIQPSGPHTGDGLVAVTVAAEGTNGAVVMSDGSVREWGPSPFRELRDGELRYVYVEEPTPVRGLPGPASSVVLTYDSTSALLEDGTVWSWGSNEYGQLGNGSSTSSRFPVRAQGLPPIAAIRGGSWHVLALAVDGTVWAWGNGNIGQLGQGVEESRSTPVRVPGLAGVRSIAAGYGASLAILDDGSVWAWGSNAEGELGTGARSERSDQGDYEELSPVPTLLTDVVDAAIGFDHTLVLRTDGTVWAVGANTFGALGDGTRDDRLVPVPVAGLANIVELEVGSRSSYARAADGALWAWGRGQSGELGNGATDAQASPSRVSQLGGPAAAIAAGESFALALLECSEVRAWGSGYHGELGNPGERADQPTPVAVQGLGDGSDCDDATLAYGVSGVVAAGAVGIDRPGAPICTGVDCDCHQPFCREVVAAGALVELTAAVAPPGAAGPDPGYRFERWHGDCQGTDPRTSVRLDGDRRCFAEFSRAPAEGELLTIASPVGGHVLGTGGEARFGTRGIDCPELCNAIYAPGAEVSLSAAPDPGFDFAGWSLDCAGAEPATTVAMDGRRTCGAVFRAFRLEVAVAGAGRVTSDPAGIDCGAACRTEPAAASVDLVATPDPGWIFAGWGGDCLGLSPATAVAMDADRSCTASFIEDENQVELTIAVEREGRVTSSPAGIDCGASCGAFFARGSTVDLTALAGPDYQVLGWFGDCAAARGATYALLMDDDKACTVSFVRIETWLPAAFFGAAPSAPDVGEPVVLDATASTTVDGAGGSDPTLIVSFAWDFEDDGVVDVVGNRTTAAVVQHAYPAPGTYTARLVVTGGFDAAGLPQSDDEVQEIEVGPPAGLVYALSVVKSGSGSGSVESVPPGLVDCDESCDQASAPSLAAGTSLTLRARPGVGQRFTGWSGHCVGTTAEIPVTMDAGRLCVASFEPLPRRLDVTVDGSGRVTGGFGGIDCPGDCSESYSHGAVVPLTALPEPGFVFDGWSGDCSGADAVLSVTLDADRTCTARFASQPGFRLTVSRVGGGAGRILALAPATSSIDCGDVCSEVFPAGTRVELAPESIDNFEGWVGCDQIVFPSCLVDMDGTRSVMGIFFGSGP